MHSTKQALQRLVLCIVCLCCVDSAFVIHTSLRLPLLFSSTFDYRAVIVKSERFL